MSESKKEMKRARGKNWDEVYLSALAKGFDNGYAAYLANCWEERQEKKQRSKEQGEVDE